MRTALLTAAGIAVLAIASITTTANAAPATQTLRPALEVNSLTEQVAYRKRYVNHCTRWRIECRARWGLGTWRYRRCLSFHGCL